LVSNDYIPSKLVVTGANSTPITSGQAASTVAGTIFANTHVGSSSAPLSIGLAAGTSAPINFTGSDYTVGGADPSDFIASDSQSTGFTITFSPTATGLRTAVVKIFTTDPATPTFRILVSGTGT
jgi:hypothetical protein